MEEIKELTGKVKELESEETKIDDLIQNVVFADEGSRHDKQLDGR